MMRHKIRHVVSLMILVGLSLAKPLETILREIDAGIPRPLTKRAALVKRGLGDDICGAKEMARSAEANRNPATWQKYGVGDWYKNAVRAKNVMNWVITYGESDKYMNMQDVMMFGYGGHDSVSYCQEISNPACDSTGMSDVLCGQYPEAHFAWIAQCNWANFLNKQYETYSASTEQLLAATNKLRTQFFTPEEDPSNLLVPVGIASGIAGGISGFYGPIAAVAGAGTIASAIITQANLDKVDPLEQWGGISDALGGAYKGVIDTLENLFNDTLTRLPNYVQDQPDYSKPPIDEDPLNTPMIFHEGTFASHVAVGAFNYGVFGSLAAACINALWQQDGAFLMKLTDAVYGKGTGEACKAFPDETYCEDGVAYIWLRFTTTYAGNYATSLGLNVNQQPEQLNPDTWHVRGLSSKGKGGDGSENGEHLKEYNLDKDVIARSAIKTYNANGYPFENQNGATLNEIKNNPTNYKLEDVMFFSVPICELDKVVPEGKHIKDQDLARWAGCTCALQKPENGAKSAWPNDGAGYAWDSNEKLTRADCQAGWV